MYSPGYVGPARWVLFEPRSRRAFSALGKDVVPDAISVLERASGSATRDQLVAEHEHVTPGHIDALVRAGLLMEDPPTTDAAASFLASFHTANIDYPFFDYGSPSVVQNESDLLDHYAKLWPAPPPILERTGRRSPLPKVDPISGVEPSAPDLTPESLSWMLRTVLVPVGRIRTRHANCVRRTTPSGGARHPTELAVVLRAPMGDIPAGTFTFDIASGALVSEPDDVHTRYVCGLDGQAFGVVVRTRIERAMWRYRDLRALRPVLIDAGHVVELVVFLLARLGIPAEVVSPPVAALGAAWLEEPDVAVVRPAGGPGRQPPTVVTHAASDGSRAVRNGIPRGAAERDRYLINPALVLRFRSQMYASVLWPSVSNVPLDLTDFLILNHCLPSTRGDRVTTVAGIVEAIDGATVDGVERLRATGALLPLTEAVNLYDGSRLWVRYEWYMALLTYLEAFSNGVAEPVASRVDPDAEYVVDIKALYARHTSRVFTADHLALGTLERLLSRVFADGSGAPEVTLAVWNVNGLGSGLYRWRNGRLRYLGAAPSRADVATNSAGQTAASSGALALWMSSLTEVDQPARYMMDLVDLGRLGQRLCAAAAELEIAVFLTPAVHDRGTCRLLGLGAAERRLTYVFGIGVADRSSQPSITAQTRSPSSP